MNAAGTLYVVATPIGNLQDMTYRAVETLRSVDLIACEDTRQTVKLLDHYGIACPMTSYHDFNEGSKTPQLLERLRLGTRIALLSDSGTPTISDPGFDLVRACHEAGIRVVPIPGASALAAAISVAGLPTDRVFFDGFLPAKTAARRERLRELQSVDATLVLYEAPHRIEESLADIETVLGDRKVCIARELTKLHETIEVGSLSEVRKRVTARGEFVLVIAGATQKAAPVRFSVAGLSRQETLKVLASQLGIPRSELYNALFKKDE